MVFDGQVLQNQTSGILVFVSHLYMARVVKELKKDEPQLYLKYQYLIKSQLLPTQASFSNFFMCECHMDNGLMGFSKEPTR